MQKDPLVRSVDAHSMRLQIARRAPARIAQHALWCEAQTRLAERCEGIVMPQGPRLDHGVAQYGQAMQIAPHSSGLIWSVGLLAYLSDPRSTLAYWSGLLMPGGLLMFATLGPDSFRSLALALGDEDQARHVLPHPDMHDIGDALVACGLVDPVMDAEWIEFTYSTPESALTDLRLLSGNALSKRPAHLCGRAWQRRVLAALESLRAQGAIRLRIELVFGHAWSPDLQSQTRKAAAGQPQPVQWISRNHKTP